MSWLAKKTNNKCPSERRRHTAFLYENDMYLYGGDLKPVNRDDHPLFYSKKIYKYSVRENIWSEIKQKPNDFQPEGRFAHTSVVYKDSLIVFAGIISGLYLNNLLFEYNFKENEWKSIDYQNHSSTPLFMFAHSAVIYKDKMIIYGGESISSLILNNILEYNFKNNTFMDVTKTKGDVPLHGRFAHTSIEYNGTMFIFGGKNDFVGRYNSILSYEIDKKYWKKIPNLGDIPSGRAGHSMSLFEDKFYIFGGFDGENDLNDLYCFDLKSNRWTLIDFGLNMPQNSSFHSMICFKEKNSKLLLFGGLEGSDDSFKI
eukprot:gene1226-11316_t